MALRGWYQFFPASARREEGQTMAEYGVVLALICLGVVAALGVLALGISGKLSVVTNVLGSSL